MAKKKTIRGILIDAEHCTVREVEFENPTIGCSIAPALPLQATTGNMT